ncbi:MAG: phytochelatin synthase [Aquabacterium sp.]|uniref:phytochelatin synthase family protein n=1 Tax=Aquabacterium sp. TaxID=1872578 RepID=UPI001202AB64|nr:phytochelatin synthase family protein [Aquabacterium sp.]TAK88627.1 MAG: phytochelatin synthase [Aquabacterium sp.]
MNGRLSSAWLLALALLGGSCPPARAADSSSNSVEASAAVLSSPAVSAPALRGTASVQAAPYWQDKLLLDKAWALPVASRYKTHIEFQHNLTFCGPSSIANVGHSLGSTLDQRAVLEDTGVSTTLGYLPSGLTLDELAGVAQRRFAPGHVTVWRGLSLDAFRQHLRQANELGRRYIVNFSRAPLFGQGGGHHSPIAGYLAAQDLVLVLDVNQSFGPWLVKPERLLEAMNTVDSQSGKLRGLLLIEP